MGTSTSVDQLAAKLEAAARNLARAEEVSVAESAAAGKAIMAANMGFTRMRGVGKKGAKVGVRYEYKGGANPSALLRYTGPVHLANNDTSAHRIEPKRSGRRSGARALNIAGNPRASAEHPGTSGKHFHERSMPQVKKAAGEILSRSVATALNRTF